MQLKLDEKKIRKGRPIGLPYIGSKKKIAKKLIEIIKQNFGTDKTIYDLFGGGGAITLECKLQGLDVVYNDIDPIPGQLIQKILSEDREYIKSLICSREEFFQIRDKEDKTIDDHLKLLINSFGNNKKTYLYSKKHSDVKYALVKEIIEKHDCFYGYKQTETYKRCIAKNGRLKHLVRIEQLGRAGQLERLQQLERVKEIKFYYKDYKEFSEIKNSIIYLDPPYEELYNTYKYNKLNYEEFYSWCKSMSKENIVLIGGYHMPDDFEVVYEFKTARSTMQSGQHESKYEKLYMIK